MCSETELETFEPTWEGRQGLPFAESPGCSAAGGRAEAGLLYFIVEHMSRHRNANRNRIQC